MRIKRLTYWIATCLDDAAVYNIRTRTRREAFAKWRELTAGGCDYAKPRKVTVEYTDAFELVTECLGEGGADWEPEKFEY